MKKILFNVILTVAISLLPFLSTSACTIFVLTDGTRTLFFNNEDFSNPNTRMWFLPGDKQYYGCTFVGFDDGWAQGGVNAEGLAFDWVAGVNEQYVSDPAMENVRGNPSERMLESCRTVDEAIAFYKKFKEPSFAVARILIADKTGKSVIIGASDGKLYFDISTVSRGFGYGAKNLTDALSKSPAPTVSSGIPILQACKQEGIYATKYSSIYNLQSGDIYLVDVNGQRPETKISIASELAKGPHYFEIPTIDQQATDAPKALLPSMKRFLSDGYTPLKNSDHEIENRVRSIYESMKTGTLNAADFEGQFYAMLLPMQKEIQNDVAKLGKLESLTLLETGPIDGGSTNLFLIEYENCTVIQRFNVDKEKKVTMIKAEGAEVKIR